MRLWHKDLIPYLPRQQLLGQWRECCAIAKSIVEKGTPNHVLVNKVMDYPIGHFVRYCRLVAGEMIKRGYVCQFKRLAEYLEMNEDFDILTEQIFEKWHNDRYMRQCLYNLQEKADCGAIPEDEWERITDQWPWFE